AEGIVDEAEAAPGHGYGAPIAEIPVAAVAADGTTEAIAAIAAKSLVPAKRIVVQLDGPSRDVQPAAEGGRTIAPGRTRTCPVRSGAPLGGVVLDLDSG